MWTVLAGTGTAFYPSQQKIESLFGRLIRIDTRCLTLWDSGADYFRCSSAPIKSIEPEIQSCWYIWYFSSDLVAVLYILIICRAPRWYWESIVLRTAICGLYGWIYVYRSICLQSAISLERFVPEAVAFIKHCFGVKSRNSFELGWMRFVCAGFTVLFVGRHPWRPRANVKRSTL